MARLAKIVAAKRKPKFKVRQRNRCEVCGRTDGYFEVHHVKKLKDIEKGTEPWKKQMIARNRKTMVLCVECHDLLHSGNLPNWKYKRIG